MKHKKRNIRQRRASAPRRRRVTAATFLAVALGAAALAGLPFLGGTSDMPSGRAPVTMSDSPSPQHAVATTSTTESHRLQFALCGRGKRISCVVDGDTFWLQGTKIRIADIDTPETSQPGCRSEHDLGMQATTRLIELLNDGPFEVQPSGSRDQDIHGRALRIVVRDGQSLGEQLVKEGLARRWAGRRQPWC